MKLFQLTNRELCNPLQVETITRADNQNTGKFDVELSFVSGYVFTQAFDTDAERTAFVADFRSHLNETP